MRVRAGLSRQCSPRVQGKRGGSRRPKSFLGLSFRSEVESQCHLHNPGAVNRKRRLANGGSAIQVATGPSEVWMIEHVEGIDLELQFAVLGYLERLVETQVKIDIAGSG